MIVAVFIYDSLPIVITKIYVEFDLGDGLKYIHLAR